MRYSFCLPALETYSTAFSLLFFALSQLIAALSLSSSSPSPFLRISSFLRVSPIWLSLYSNMIFSLDSLSSNILAVVLHICCSSTPTDSSKVFCLVFFPSFPSLSSLTSSLSCFICAVLLEKATISSMHFSMSQPLLLIPFPFFPSSYKSCASCRANLSLRVPTVLLWMLVRRSLPYLHLMNYPWRLENSCYNSATLCYKLQADSSLAFIQPFCFYSSFMVFFICACYFLAESVFLVASLHSASALARACLASNMESSLDCTSFSKAAFCLRSLPISSLSNCLQFVSSPVLLLASQSFLRSFYRSYANWAVFCCITDSSAFLSPQTLLRSSFTCLFWAYSPSMRLRSACLSSSDWVMNTLWACLNCVYYCSMAAFFLRLPSQSLLIIAFSILTSLIQPYKARHWWLSYQCCFSSCWLLEQSAWYFCMQAVSQIISSPFLAQSCSDRSWTTSLSPITLPFRIVLFMMAMLPPSMPLSLLISSCSSQATAYCFISC